MKEFADYVTTHTKEQAMIFFNITEETFHRKIRKCKQKGILPREYRYTNPLLLPKDNKKKVLAERLIDKYSEAEIKAILESDVNVRYTGVKKEKFETVSSVITFGILSDTHIGSKYFNEANFINAIETFENSNVDFVCHVGDVTEGLSRRDGHPLEVTHYGYKDQRDYAVNLLSKIKVPLYVISGNHDRWFLKQNGADIVEDICSRIPNSIFLGHDEGDIITNGITIKLWHGEDGASYATSYRLQKIIESIDPENRPDFLIAGHDHKSLYLPEEQGVTALGAGSIQSQTKWMRGKRLPAKCGFWMVELTIEDGKIKHTLLKWHKLD